MIELVFKCFKNDLGIRTTDAQDDFTVMGEEFVNTIASTITCRLINIFQEKELMSKDPYGDIMDDLSGILEKGRCPGRWRPP